MSYDIAPGEDAKCVVVGTDKTPSGELIEYAWFSGRTGPHEGVVVIKTDRFGQRWRLELARRGAVTFRVAAGLLNVTTPTIANWQRAGVFPNAFKKKNVMLIPIRDIERIARKKRIALPFAE